MFRKLILGLFLLALVSCEPAFEGCGPVVGINPPEPQYTTHVVEDDVIRVPTGRYYYTVTIKGDDGKNHKVFVSYDTWINCEKGEIICTY